jgi:hypothetical protein
MLFRRPQPAANGEAAAVAAQPAQPPPAASVLDGTETPKVAKVKVAVQKFRTDIYRIALRMKVGTTVKHVAANSTAVLGWHR